MSAPRHRSRQIALQVLFAADLADRSREGPTPSAEEVFDRVGESFDLPDDAREFAKQLVCGVLSRRDQLDSILAEHARNWRVSRMAAVDRNILRFATYELAHTDTPTANVLDESIELARRFGDDPSPKFVNGVLDAVARSLRPDEKATDPPSGVA